MENLKILSKQYRLKSAGTIHIWPKWIKMFYLFWPSVCSKFIFIGPHARWIWSLDGLKRNYVPSLDFPLNGSQFVQTEKLVYSIGRTSRYFKLNGSQIVIFEDSNRTRTTYLCIKTHRYFSNNNIIPHWLLPLYLCGSVPLGKFGDKILIFFQYISKIIHLNMTRLAGVVALGYPHLSKWNYIWK